MAKWIKYQIVCNQKKNILLDKKLGYSEVNLIIAQSEAYNGHYEIIEDDKNLENPFVNMAAQPIGVKCVRNICVGFDSVENVIDSLAPGEIYMQFEQVEGGT